MDFNAISKQAAETILESGVDFRVTVDRKKLIHRLGAPTEKTFVIYPLKMGALIQISKIWRGVVSEPLESEKLLEVAIKSLSENHDKLLEVLAVAIQNRKGDPPRSLVKYLERNLTAADALKLLTLVIKQMRLTDFLSCMVSIGKMDMMGTGSTTGESLEESSNTSGSPGKKSSGAEVLPTS